MDSCQSGRPSQLQQDKKRKNCHTRRKSSPGRHSPWINTRRSYRMGQPTVVWVLVGGGSVLVIGGLCYTILVGVACRNVKRWENLRGKVQELPVTDDLIEEIGTKYSTLYPIPKIFLSDIEGDETNPSDVKRVSRDLINQLRSYNEIKCK